MRTIVIMVMLTGCSGQLFDGSGMGDPDASAPPDMAKTSEPDLSTSPDLAELQPQPDLLVLDLLRVDTAHIPVFQSCINLPKTCLGGDCCENLPVPGGTFDRSNDPAAPATVSAFTLERYEVTVSRFRAFVRAGKGTQASPPAAGTGASLAPGTGWDAQWNAMLPKDTAALITAVKCDPNFYTWTDFPGAKESTSINCVSWFEAFAFCIWDDGRLPTEAEWNFAAAGGNEQRAYPWSRGPMDLTIDTNYAVYNGIPISSVGSRSPKGDGRWGQADMAGNTWEWVFDGYANYIVPCADCANTAAVAMRVLRGGNFGANKTVLLTSSRGSVAPTHRDNSSGFRCAH